MKTIKLTMGEALVKAMQAQYNEHGEPLFKGVFAIFGHGNVAGLGQALEAVKHDLPTFRAHNEQAMAHAAIAFAKQTRRNRMMAVTTSIGPGATNLITAAALATINRLPVLLLPSDIFASRRPDPVLQQLENFQDATLSVNDCFKPVSKFFDKIMRPEQLIQSFTRAMQVLTDPSETGAVTLSLPQDVQTENYDYPISFFEKKIWKKRRIKPDENELKQALNTLESALKPLIIVGGGANYSECEDELLKFIDKFKIPFCETQAGKGLMPSTHPLNAGALGVTGTDAANALARESDCIILIGSRLQDFTTGSKTLFNENATLIGLNINSFDAPKLHALPLLCDAKEGLKLLLNAPLILSKEWETRAKEIIINWRDAAHIFTNAVSKLPSDAEILGALQLITEKSDIIVCAAGGLPGDLHKFWLTGERGGYHLEYGYSCMGYEIAGGLGVKMAEPQRDVIVVVGDGSYMMMNSEIHTSLALNQKLIIVLLDNGGFGCINRLQQATGGAMFNNLLENAPEISFTQHAKSMGANAYFASSIDELKQAFKKAKSSSITTLIEIKTNPNPKKNLGGSWWDVAVSENTGVVFEEYKQNLKKQRI